MYCSSVENGQQNANGTLVTPLTGQLSLAIPPWVGTMSTSDGWAMSRHIVHAVVTTSCDGVYRWFYGDITSEHAKQLLLQAVMLFTGGSMVT